MSTTPEFYIQVINTIIWGLIGWTTFNIYKKNKKK